MSGFTSSFTTSVAKRPALCPALWPASLKTISHRVKHMVKLQKHSSPLLMKLLMKLFSKKQLSCAKQGLIILPNSWVTAPHHPFFPSPDLLSLGGPASLATRPTACHTPIPTKHLRLRHTTARKCHHLTTHQRPPPPPRHPRATGRSCRAGMSSTVSSTEEAPPRSTASPSSDLRRTLSHFQSRSAAMADISDEILILSSMPLLHLIHVCSSLCSDNEKSGFLSLISRYLR
jgi:hypothetical protein